jgi:CubicO group peptidase (beta-lactamase class C family)
MGGAIDEWAGSARIQGFCAPGFEPVLAAFRDNFLSRGEVGAGVALSVGGVTRVDLWGGASRVPAGLQADALPGVKAEVRADAQLNGLGADTDTPWTRDSLVVVFSCTKAATALAAHVLIDRGLLDPEAPVTEYWPEFGAAGKADVTVAMMLNHSAGVPALRAPVAKGGFLDWDYMVGRLAAEAPFWEPGTRNGYHMSTFGWTVGELVRRVSGQSLGAFFRAAIAEPLGIDFWIGLPDAEHPRVSGLLPWLPERGAPVPAFTRALQLRLKDPEPSLQYLALMNTGGHRSDTPAAWRAEFGGGGGIANARALAGMYAPLANGGTHNGVRIVSAEQVERMRAVSAATQVDATLLMPTRFGAGFMRSMDNRRRPAGHMESMLLGRSAFGHAGAGGSVGFADPELGLAFGYAMNRMGAGILLNERGQALVDATYRVLGCAGTAAGAPPGAWTPSRWDARI